ncbi:hypothetical protein ACFLYQ_01470 [Chloroflexota bacterium]
MKRKLLCLILSYSMVLSLLMVSCNTAITPEQEVVLSPTEGEISTSISEPGVSDDDGLSGSQENKDESDLNEKKTNTDSDVDSQEPITSVPESTSKSEPVSEKEPSPTTLIPETSSKIELVWINEYPTIIFQSSAVHPYSLGFRYESQDDITCLVKEVFPASSAEEAGLLKGDLILIGESLSRIEDGREMILPTTFTTILAGLRTDKVLEVLLKTERDNEVIFYVLIHSE